MKAQELVSMLKEQAPGARATVSYYMAEKVALEVKAVAAARGITASEAAEWLLRAGLAFYQESGEEKGAAEKARGGAPQRRRRHPRS
ncbi:MAG: hypothetical protein HY907_11475 [Deltaproteobacteria bacterium]|nr:hypothetical protein [Deltaproteobacteria bacterium]